MLATSSQSNDVFEFPGRDILRKWRPLSSYANDDRYTEKWIDDSTEITYFELGKGNHQFWWITLFPSNIPIAIGI